MLPWKRRPGSDLSMLDHLRRLTIDLPSTSERVSCVLTYAIPASSLDHDYVAVPARERGYEGIACLDDTARAAVLALDLFEANREEESLEMARAWLNFVHYMQYPDGSFANFVIDEEGTRNETGPTSYRGGSWWSARAKWALSRAFVALHREEDLAAFEACHVEAGDDLKIQALLAIGELILQRSHPKRDLESTVLKRCDHIIDSAVDYFREKPTGERLELWGYHQLRAVAMAAQTFERDSYLSACQRTVASLVQPDIEQGPWYSFPDREQDGVCAYAITPLVEGLEVMWRQTGDTDLARLARLGAEWFYGRNAAETQMYDPDTGRCRDGIDKGVASDNYGAESSIEAGFAELMLRRLTGTRGKGRA